MTQIVILIALVATLVFTIVDDWRNYTIRNEAILILLALFAARMIALGDYAHIGGQLMLAAFMFVTLLIIYSRGWMGGGDVKLLAVAFLWIGVAELSTFTLLMCALVIVYYVAAKLKFAPSRGQARVYIPFAPCISGAWLLTLALNFAKNVPP
ncbi:A24 family peptidase [Methylocystis parvus]|uniref:A24 family peptidase n=1 Tax=Methylocystis parvus TaxID=134 RepID=UPI003C741867